LVGKKYEFVAGPFDQPPLSNFRINQSMAAVQGERIRLVINMSSPKGSSFNKRMNKEGIEEVGMTSARKVSYSTLVAGKNPCHIKTRHKRRLQTCPGSSQRLEIAEFSLSSKVFCRNPTNLTKFESC
jgi:hypothetical protein